MWDLKYNSTHFNLVTRWVWVVNFTLTPSSLPPLIPRETVTGAYFTGGDTYKCIFVSSSVTLNKLYCTRFYLATTIHLLFLYTGHTHKNGAVVIVFTIKTAPFFCVCPVFVSSSVTLNKLYCTRFYLATTIHLLFLYTGHTHKNGAVVIVFTIKTAPFFCVCPVH
jgi:hypothetical protein